MSELPSPAESGGELEAVREEARAAAMYVVHLRREVERCRVELEAARAEIEGLRARLAAARSLPGLEPGLWASAGRVLRGLRRRLGGG